MSEARIETTKPVASRYADATQTSPQPKNLVKVRSGATLESITVFKPANNPVASPQPMIAEITPSNKNEVGLTTKMHQQVSSHQFHDGG